MICPKCGAPNPDNSTFCNGCGNALTAQQAPTTPSQPMYSQQPQQYGQQPAYNQQAQYSQPQQPYNQQQPQYGQQPMYGQQPTYNQQPMYGAPYYAPPKKSHGAVIAVVCGIVAVIAAFLVVLFVVIIPKSKNGGSVGGGTAVTDTLNDKVRHKWLELDEQVVYDFASNTAYEIEDVSYTVPFSWNLSGEVLTFTMFGETDRYNVSISSDGRNMTLTGVDFSRTVRFIRYD